MDFLSFLKSLPEQDHKGSQDFMAFVRADRTSQPQLTLKS
jgi:hypothetical protein